MTWAGALDNALEALLLITVSATIMYISQYAIKWSAEKMKQLSLVLSPIEIERDPERIGLLVQGFEFLESCIPTNCEEEVGWFLTYTLYGMIIKYHFEYFNHPFITFRMCLAGSFVLVMGLSLYRSIGLVGSVVIHNLRARRELWQACRERQDLTEQLKQTRKQLRKSMRDMRGVMLKQKAANRENVKERLAEKWARDQQERQSNPKPPDWEAIMRGLELEEKLCEEDEEAARARDVGKAKKKMRQEKSRGRRMA
ncbi:hypothetical protein PRZ48_006808 [Zasmidium cellare]|uniref:Uncharacterized protein n=1 Tax=Zasmidium cellare TaxID=395010 RepID=A0ABR0EHL2_ZASCE|nr:hypothetical protein PRZ48_006808 [Zasmidium cellare]